MRLQRYNTEHGLKLLICSKCSEIFVQMRVNLGRRSLQTKLKLHSSLNVSTEKHAAKIYRNSKPVKILVKTNNRKVKRGSFATRIITTTIFRFNRINSIIIDLTALTISDENRTDLTLLCSLELLLD